MSILVKNMKMPTRCWDCPFYKIGHEESYCGLTGKDVARWTPTPRPDDCPLIEVEPTKHGHWIWTGKERPGAPESIRCSQCGFWYIKLTPRFYCSNCGAKMDEGREDD